MGVDEETRARRAACTDSFLGNGLVRPRELIATIDPDAEPDTYGERGVVAELERHVAALLGKPAAVFLPSGTMAQAATLRVHADARGPRTVVWHPYCHLDRHEGQGYQRLHQLVGRHAGDLEQLLTLDDLRQVAEPIAALLLEDRQEDRRHRRPRRSHRAARLGDRSTWSRVVDGAGPAAVRRSCRPDARHRAGSRPG